MRVSSSPGAYSLVGLSLTSSYADLLDCRISLEMCGRRATLTRLLVASKLVLSFSQKAHKSFETRSLSYNAAIPWSPLANTISIRSMVTQKKGQYLYISCSMWRFLTSFLIAYLKTATNPYHTGRWNLVCVQAKILGIARRDSIPPLSFRFDGLLPMCIRPYSSEGAC
ncbi:hypothetical protein Rs2_26433 [Raphanus sativus]|nr:hypothetical protein Rs2_26433 [Raphanus sativus]